MFKLLPQQIPNVDVTPFVAVTKTKVLPATRNRRLFGIVNTGTDAMQVFLQQDGTGAGLFLKAASTLGSCDGASLEFNGYNGPVWAIGTGYIYHFSE